MATSDFLIINSITYLTHQLTKGCSFVRLVERVLRVVSPHVVVRRVVVDLAAVVREHTGRVELARVLVAVQALVLDAQAQVVPLFLVESAADDAGHEVWLQPVGVSRGFRQQCDPVPVVVQLRVVLDNRLDAQGVFDRSDLVLLFFDLLLELGDLPFQVELVVELPG